MSSVCCSYVLVCHPYFTHMYLYVIRILLVYHPYVTRMHLLVIRVSLVCTRMSSVCDSYIVVCHSYITRMYSCAICMSLVARVYSCVIRISLLFARIHPCVTHMYSCMTRVSLVCTHISSIPCVTGMCSCVICMSHVCGFAMNYFQQDNYKIQFLVGGLGTRMLFELFISFHQNTFSFETYSRQLLEAFVVQLVIIYHVNVSLVVTALWS